jgi:4-hydroxy-tetrahydrodipicolinate reductase
MRVSDFAIYGLGPIGRAFLEAVRSDPRYRPVEAVDTDPSLAGISLGELMENPEWDGIPVTGSAEPNSDGSPGGGENRGVRQTGDSVEDPALAVVCTGSRLEDTAPLIRRLAERGMSVISTCEELAFPVPETEARWAELDTLSRRLGVSILGTGINPGFIMDLLPVLMTAPCLSIERMAVSRQINAATRRRSFQRKIGCGLSPSAFEEEMRSARISGHVGLRQSLYLIAAALGRRIEEITENRIEPVTAPASGAGSSHHAGAGTSGEVLGLRQTLSGHAADNGARRTSLELRFCAYLGAPEEFDRIEVEGNPSFNTTTAPCIQGETGTAGLLKNSIPALLHSSPGLKTALELFPPHFG